MSDNPHESFRPEPRLPADYTAAVPGVDDVSGLVRLINAHRESVGRSPSMDAATVTAEVVGPGSWTRRQAIAVGPDGDPVAWAIVHDRAAGRTDVRMYVHPALTGDAREAVASAMVAWQQETGRQITIERGLDETQLDGLIDQGDVDHQRWLTEAGYRQTRTWLNMTRPVAADETPAKVRDGVTIRRVGVHELADGSTTPIATDLQTVHQMLEESFEDHFNSYRESFPEFLQRQREDTGHRWDHWWLAFVDDPDAPDAEPLPAGAVVSTVLGEDAQGVAGSYVDYIGVHARARGRGVAKSLLFTVIADAAERGRNRVGLEVDADSPTGADGLYRSLGWETDYVTQSWHKGIST